jgi:hypothetical protein
LHLLTRIWLGINCLIHHFILLHFIFSLFIFYIMYHFDVFYILPVVVLWTYGMWNEWMNEWMNDSLEECTTSISRPKGNPSMWLVSYLGYSSTMKMDAICSSERVVILLTTCHYIPEDSTLHMWTELLLNITVVAFKAMHRCQRLVHPSEQFWNWFCGMAFRAAVVLLLMWSKCLSFNVCFIFGNGKKSLCARSSE